MPKDWKLHIEDMLECMARASDYTTGMTLENFEGDRLTLDAVERNFITIGEAASRVPTDVRQAHPELPWRQIIAMRNIVVHQYSSIIPHIMWNAIHEDFPPLAPKLRHILESEA